MSACRINVDCGHDVCSLAGWLTIGILWNDAALEKSTSKREAMNARWRLPTVNLMVAFGVRWESDEVSFVVCGLASLRGF